MFNFDNASLQITKDEILKYITELQILERYCSNYKSIDSSFKSEFYSDKNGSCRIIISASGIPYYKDYAKSFVENCKKEVIIRTHKSDDCEKFGRLLAEIINPESKEVLNDLLVSDGYAVKAPVVSTTPPTSAALKDDSNAFC